MKSEADIELKLRRLTRDRKMFSATERLDSPEAVYGYEEALRWVLEQE